jgi:hypothetical protein
MPDATLDTLRTVVQDLHKCQAVLFGTVQVRGAGESVEQGRVAIFDLKGHATAERAYAWTFLTPNGAARGYLAVLHAGSVDSPQAAVASRLLPGRKHKAS